MTPYSPRFDRPRSTAESVLLLVMLAALVVGALLLSVWLQPAAAQIGRVIMTHTSVTVASVTASNVLAANVFRSYLFIENISSATTLYCAFGASPSSTNGISLLPGAAAASRYSLESKVTTQALKCIHYGTGAADTMLLVTEGN